MRRLFVPDLTAVYRDGSFHDNGYDPGAVLLVVEVVSPSTLTMDRVAKPAVYAEQGIPYFWGSTSSTGVRSGCSRSRSAAGTSTR